MKTFVMKPREVKRDWYVIDASQMVLGRMAAVIATYLRGKHKPVFTPHVDCGDHIVVINAEKIALTGRKRQNSRFYWHTGYPGGIKSRSKGEILAGTHPERVVIKAVERMMPRGPLGRDMMRKLKVYAGEDHPHAAQNPQILDLAARNTKNKK